MTSMHIRFALCAVAAASLSTAAVARSQAAIVAGQAYSRGVQAYFSGRNGDADQELLAATADDANDPRPHYFRALALLRQGRGDEARGEMMLGASLEAQNPGRYPVGRSLERVQGGDRLQLETYRRQARTQDAGLVVERQPVQSQAEQNAVRDLRGVRTKVSVPLDQLTSTSSIDDYTTGPNHSRSVSADRTETPAASAPGAALPDPFVDDPPQSAAAPASSAEADPFAPSPTASAAPAAESAAETGSKVSSGKLLGILGRVITRSAHANMPLLDEVGNKIPLPPGITPSVTPPGQQATPEAEFGAAPAAEDPFAEAPQQP